MVDVQREPVRLFQKCVLTPARDKMEGVKEIVRRDALYKQTAIQRERFHGWIDDR